MPLQIQKNEIYEMNIQGMTNEGNGVGRLDGYAVFVPETAIGDRCRVRMVKCNKSYGYGKLVELLEPSLERCTSDCRSFPQCGGCSYRHITYEAELRLKQDSVRDAFERIGGIHVPIREIIGSVRQTGYRNKAQYPVGKDSSGTLVSGFYAKRSHRIMSGAEQCALQPSIFGEIQQEILEFLRERKIAPYDESTRKGLIRHIYLRRGEVTGEIMVCIVAASSRISGMDDLAIYLKERFPDIRSVIINVNGEDTNVILGKNCITVDGSDTIQDVLCGVKVELSPLSFYQVNQPQAEVLYRKAMEYGALRKDDILLDLYCGAGTIGLAAAGLVKSVIGVEIVPQAIENAKRNAESNGIENVRFLCADAGTAAQELADEGTRPNVVVVDPPRKGLDMNVIDAIIRMNPERIVMVSCNPSTAARDAALLEQGGYQTIEVTPVDLFPRTTHTECIVSITKQTEVS